MNQKGFSPLVIILSLLIIFGIAIGAYYLGVSKNLSVQNTNTMPQASMNGLSTLFVTPTADISLDSKTYKNNTWGVSFDYQKDWNIKEWKNDGKIYNVGISPLNYTQTDPQNVIELFYYDNPTKLGLAEYDKANTGMSGMGPDLYSKDNQSVKMSNGVTAYSRNNMRMDSSLQNKVYII